MNYLSAIKTVKLSEIHTAKVVLSKELKEEKPNIKTINILSTMVIKAEDELKQLEQAIEKETEEKEKDVKPNNEK